MQDIPGEGAGAMTVGAKGVWGGKGVWNLFDRAANLKAKPHSWPASSAARFAGKCRP
jgi:hypothetical protein